MLLCPFETDTKYFAYNWVYLKIHKVYISGNVIYSMDYDTEYIYYLVGLLFHKQYLIYYIDLYTNVMEYIL